MPAVWVAAHLRLRLEKLPWGPRGAFAFQAAIGGLAWWSLIQLAGRAVSLDAGWPAWLIAVLGGTASEAVIALYAGERQTLKPLVSRWLLALRLLLVGLVLGMLLQPVVTYHTESRREQYVAVLVNESASMRLNDRNRRPAKSCNCPGCTGWRASARPTCWKKPASTGRCGGPISTRRAGREMGNVAHPQRGRRGRSPAAQAAAGGCPAGAVVGASGRAGPAGRSGQGAPRAVLLFCVDTQAGRCREVARRPRMPTTRRRPKSKRQPTSGARPPTWRPPCGWCSWEIPADRLAGVVVLSDGRHNHGAPAEPLARRLGQQSVPVSSVVFGSGNRRKGAAIADVQAAEAVFLGDKIVMTARVRATGLRGQLLKIKMTCDPPLAPGEIRGEGIAAEEKTINVADDDFRDNVPLSYTPKTAGLYRCRIELQKPADDTLESNKQVERHVTVSDSRIRLLLVDNRPRWEFRYLRNLFCGRDKTVQLQHVLLNPDRIAGEGERPSVPASAARPYGEFEATVLPKTADDWLKFDLIVLGDLPPTVLDDAAVATLKKFVGQQGGSLVVVAGPNYMPHAFTGSALAELLPATFEPSQQAVLPPPSRPIAWRRRPRAARTSS